MLFIDVERWIQTVKDKCHSYPLGRFELRGQELVLEKSGKTGRAPFIQTIPTTFGKQSFHTLGENLTPTYETFNGQEYYPPDFGIVSGISGKSD